ncbi:MAG: DUF3299 domain-containing protein [Hydrogenophaga sp.]|nr:DUF3299 domain-containing protein [Hydrogenophaga sp.]
MNLRSIFSPGTWFLGALLGVSPCLAWSQASSHGATQTITWESMAMAKSKHKDKKSGVEFPVVLSGLNGKQVKLRGFMVPLEAKPAQVHFLLTSKPQDCEFCIEGGPSSYVEVKSSVPLKFSTQPLNLVGRFLLLKDDPSGVYYRLVDARPASQP